MSDEQSLQTRLNTLEARVAYQDQVIEDLNRTVTGQWKRIDGLARQIAHLGERLKEAQGHSPPLHPGEPHPPQI